METIVKHPEFQRQRLSVRAGGLFAGTELLLDGVVVKGIRNKHSLVADSGQAISVDFKMNFMDPMPKVIVGEDVVLLSARLRWYEYLWVGLPLILMPVGGAVGGIVGGLAMFANAKIFRSNKSASTRYALTGMLSVGAIAVYFVLAVAFHALIKK